MDPSSLPSLKLITVSKENNKIELSRLPDPTLEQFATQFPEDLKKITNFRTEISDVKKLNEQVRLITAIAYACKFYSHSDTKLGQKFQQLTTSVNSERDALITKIFSRIGTSSARVMDQLTRVGPYPGDSLFDYAAYAGDTETCKKLFRDGAAEINACNYFGQTALMGAAMNDNLETVKELVAQGAKLNLVDNSGNTAFDQSPHSSAVAGFLYQQGGRPGSEINSLKRALATMRPGPNAILELFAAKTLAIGADGTITDNQGQSVLSAACDANAVPVIYELFHREPEALSKIRTRNNQTFLHMAAKGGYSDIISELLKCPSITKEFINQKDDQGKTALLLAIENNRPLTAGMLLSGGADSTIKDNEGNSAFQKSFTLTDPDPELLLALLNSTPDCNFTIGEDKNSPLEQAILLSKTQEAFRQVAEKLIDLGKSIDATNSQRQTALHIASIHAPKLVEKLLAADANPNMCDSQGFPPLAYLFQEDGYQTYTLIEPFAAKDADLNILLPNGKTLLQEAIDMERIEIVGKLLEFGADPNTKGKNGETTISILLGKSNQFLDSNPNLIQLLVAHCMNLLAWDKDGNSILHRLIEAKTNESGLLSRLFANELPGELVNHQNNKGETALLVACRNRSPWIWKLLSQLAIDPTIATTSGQAPLAALLEKDDPDCTFVLQRAVASLLHIGASADITLKGNNSLLHYAAKHGWNNIVVWILAGSQNKNELLTKQNDAKETALNTALAFSQSSIAIYLIQQGAKLHELPDNVFDLSEGVSIILEILATGSTPYLLSTKFLNQVILHSADNSEWQHVIDRLLELRVDLNSPSEADSPLEIACDIGNQSLIYELLERGAKPDRVVGTTSNSSLRILARNCTHSTLKPGLIQKFLEKGANLNASDSEGNTPLLLAFPNGALVGALLDAGANPNCTNQSKKCPLQLAVGYNLGTVIEKLLAKGALLSSRDKDGLSLFQLAATGKNNCFIDICIAYLIAHGSLLDPIDEQGNTILHAVVETGDQNFIKTVLRQKNLFTKDFINKKNKDEKTALDIALDHFNGKSAELLVDVGADSSWGPTRGTSRLKKAFQSAPAPSLILKMLTGSPQAINFAFLIQIGEITTPLIYAIEQKSQNQEWEKVIDRLLELKADLAAQDSNKYDALGRASLAFDKPLIKKLLEAGANPNTKTGDYMRPALANLAHSNCGFIDEPLLALFLEKGADLNAFDSEHKTPLLLALRSPINERAALSLLKSGADPKIAHGNKDTPLHCAALAGSSPVVRALIQKQVDLDAVNIFGDTALHLALDTELHLALRQPEALAVAHLLLDAGAKPHIANTSKVTPLHLAATYTDEALVQKLIAKGCPLNDLDSKGQTPLVRALKNKQSAACALLLLEKGADPNLFAGTPPLHVAIEQGNDMLVRKLLEKGTSLSSLDQEGLTPMQKAVEKGYAKFIDIVIEHLTSRGLDLENLDDKGTSLLHMVARTGSTPFIKTVLEKTKPSKELINKPNKKGDTPLHMALEIGCLSAVELLLAQGADPAKKNSAGKSALQLAFEKNWPDVALAMLATPGLDINWTLPNNVTPFLYACFRDAWSAVALRLLDFDIKNIDQKNASNETALSLAAKSPNWPLVKKLLEKGADPNIQTGPYQWTIMHTLATSLSQIDKEVLKLLKEKKANLNATSEGGYTPLLMALSYDDELALWLIENGADLNSANVDGVTVLYLAVGNKKEKIVEKLIEKGAHLDVVTKKGDTLLDAARIAKYDNFITLYLNALEKQKIPLDNIDGKNSTVLHWAAKSGNLHFVEEILKQPFATQEFIQQKNQSGEHALASAFLGENPTVIFKLLKYNFPLNFEVSLNGQHFPPLLAAQWTLYNNSGTAQKASWYILTCQLLEASDKNISDKNGRNMLHIACEMKQYNDISFLLEKGIEANKKTVTGKTALMLLAEAKPGTAEERDLQKAAAEQLLAKKVDIDAQDDAGRTAFIIACENETVQMASFLREKGAKTSLLPKNKKAPLHVFIQQGWNEEFQNALENGSCLNTTDKEGNTLLHEVILWNRPELFYLLLDQKSLNIDITARNKDNKTFIECLPENDTARIFVQILSSQADLSKVEDLQKFLASLEEDPSPIMGCERSPLEIAFLLGNPSIIRTLLAKKTYTKAGLEKDVEALKEKYLSPFALQFLAPVEQFRINTLYTIDLRHIDSLPAIPPAPKETSPEMLLAIFDKAAIPPAELKLKTKEEGTKKLTEFFLRLDSKDLQHQQIAAACCHLALRLEKSGTNKKAVFEKLFPLLDKKGAPLYVGFLELYGQLGIQKIPEGVTIDNLKNSFSGDQKSLEEFIQKVKNKTLPGLEKESPKYEEIEIALAHIAQALTIPGFDTKTTCERLTGLFSLSNSTLSSELQKLERKTLIDSITALFLALDSSHWATFGATNKDELKAKSTELSEFIRKITNKLLAGLNPEKFASTYEQMEVAICRMATAMLSNKASQVEVFGELFKLFATCGPALYSEILELFYKTCRNIPLTCDNAILLSLENFRRSLIKGIISLTIASRQTRHDYIGLIKSYPEIGLPEAAELGSFEDFYSGCARPAQHLEVMNTFWKRYNPAAACEWVMLHFLGDRTNCDRFIDYMKMQMPKEFHPEMSKKEDREHAYLSEVLYDEKFQIRLEVVIGELVKLGILRGL